MQATPKASNAKKGGYKPAIHEKVIVEMALLGATEAQIAKALDVSWNTFATWKNSNPELLETLKGAKEQADDVVCKSLYKRALGYSHPDVHISNFQGEITVTPITKHYPPDTVACIFWLKNRQPLNWREKADNGLTQTMGDASIIVNVFQNSPASAKPVFPVAIDSNGNGNGNGHHPRGAN